jgi:nitronate monooxygenase
LRHDLVLDRLAVPIVLAPLAGGPSTPELTAAVSNAGGFGFLAAGYLAASALAERLERTWRLTEAPVGVNLFVPGTPSPPQAVGAYAARLAGEARRAGVELGRARFDDDGWAAKLALVRELRIPVVSFTGGCPAADAIAALHDAGCAVWVTVTTPAEAREAARMGADALVVQGVEAGAHRGSFDDRASGDVGLLALLQLLRAAVGVPLVATGGIATRGAVAAVLAAGARAAQVGTAFMLCPEAGTSAPHREALRSVDRETGLTRAFSGRLARGIRNEFMAAHDGVAPIAYPELHYLTAPLRKAARENGDESAINLWAGQAYRLAREAPAAEVVRELAP